MSQHLSHILCGAAALVALVAFSAKAQDLDSKAQVCGACHGPNGVPTNATPNAPIIWGQQATWLYKELHDYQSGARENSAMSPVAKTISLADLRQLADYFAAKKWPANAHPAAAAAAPAAMTNCHACHGDTYQGAASAPRLAGENYQYLLAQMNDFADGNRTNNLDMPGLMKALSERQREAIARYLAGL